MTESRDEDRLRRLLDDTLRTVEPDDRLDQILQRTKVTSMSARRPWLWGAGGAMLATAAVITAVTLVGNPLKESAEPGPSTTSDTTPTQTVVTDPSDATSGPTPSESTTPVNPGGPSVGIYYVGDTPQGERLYREFRTIIGPTDALSGAVQAAVEGAADDPDYRSEWPAGTSATAVATADQITVDLSGDVHDRPATMTRAQARLAIQQLIFTAQAAVQQGRLPVQLLIDGQHTDQVLGEAASEPLANDDPNSVLSLVSLSDPSEGQHASGTLHVGGVANSFEANVPWQLLRGDKVVDQGSFMAEGAYDKLYPFAGDIDLAKLSPGTYTLRVQTDDPSGGEGPGPMSDTRTTVVG